MQTEQIGKQLNNGIAYKTIVFARCAGAGIPVGLAYV